ncbi:MAG: hypothetical protein KF678_13410 [Phycisphaeraceae bacterium]|nr:hypothetical protein [Phycisphaeraceae bacterium]
MVAVPMGMGDGAEEGVGGAAGGFLVAAEDGLGAGVVGGEAVVLGVEVGLDDEAEGLDGGVLGEGLGVVGAAAGEAFEAVEDVLGAGVFEEVEEFDEGEAAADGDVGEVGVGVGELGEDLIARGGGEAVEGGRSGRGDGCGWDLKGRGDGRGIGRLGEAEGREDLDGSGDGQGGHEALLYRGGRGRVCAHGGGGEKVRRGK